MRIRKTPSKRALVRWIADLQGQILELQHKTSESTLRTLVEKVVTMRSDEISKLTDHAVKAIRLLIDAGVITQEQANEAIR